MLYFAIRLRHAASLRFFRCRLLFFADYYRYCHYLMLAMLIAMLLLLTYATRAIADYAMLALIYVDATAVARRAVARCFRFS